MLEYKTTSFLKKLSTVERVHEKIKTVLVEHSDTYREQMVDFLNHSEQCICSGAFHTAEEAIQQLYILQPDVVVMNVSLSDMTGIELIKRVRHSCPATQFMICTVKEDVETIFAAFKAGAKGYLLKKTPPSKILEAILELHQGGSPLSPEIARTFISSFDSEKIFTDEFTKREKELLHLLLNGFRYKEIAEKLFISMDTVRTHIKHIYKKLEVNSRTHAILKLQHHEKFYN